MNRPRIPMQLADVEERFMERCYTCGTKLEEASATRDYCPACHPSSAVQAFLAVIAAREAWLRSPEGVRWVAAQQDARVDEKNAECERLLHDLARRQRRFVPPKRTGPGACRSNPRGRSIYAQDN